MTKEILYVDTLPDYTRMRYARYGEFSVMDMDTEYKYINNRYLDADTGMLPGDLVVNYFRQFKQRNKGMPYKIGVPTYAKPSVYHDAVYIDIRRAYLQIGSVLGFSSSFDENGNWVLVGDEDFRVDFFDRIKLARGMIYTLTTRIGSARYWLENKGFKKEYPNPLYSQGIQFGLPLILNAIASECYPFMYWNTDGMIVPSFAYHRIKRVLDSWNLEHSIKFRGTVDVRSVGVYAFNNTVPKRKGFGYHMGIQYPDNIRKLKDKFLMVKDIKGLTIMLE
jgi:hypothetical protein